MVLDQSRGSGAKKGRRRDTIPRRRRRGRAFSLELAGTLQQILDILGQVDLGLRMWLALNLAILTVAMLQLWRGARSGNGRISLCALSRTMPLEETEKARSKRLYRLLRNKYLEAPQLTPLLVRLALGTQARGCVPIVVDQTTIQGVPTLMAGLRIGGRVLPVAFTSFECDQIQKSQNALEEGLLILVAASLPQGCKPLYVMDRGYARASLLRRLGAMGIPYLIRARSNVIVRIGRRRLSLNRIRLGRKRRLVRFARVLYHDTRQEPVDLVVYHDPEFKEPWYLLVPPGSGPLLSSKQVVDLYRERMHIELTFRDWKTHLGLRGLRLEIDVAPRLERLLLALSVAYILTILLGCSPASSRVRADCEVLRTTPRHGTRRRLGALSVGILLLSLPRFASLAQKALARVLNALRRGRGGVTLATAPP